MSLRPSEDRRSTNDGRDCFIAPFEIAMGSPSLEGPREEKERKRGKIFATVGYIPSVVVAI